MKFSDVLCAGAILLVVNLHWNAAIAAEAIVGRASVIDGDTIEIRGEHIRLHGVDAPESWQSCNDGDGVTYRCGKEAAMTLDQFLAVSRPTRCEFVERDRYGRFVGICFRADGREINRWLVESGNAVDWARYSDGRYAAVQATARSKGVGLWRGKFQLPCEARAEHAGREPTC
ncbi:succinoglycan biosynthesis protein ExoI [Sinorhizobium fredii USDA 205]|uniref:Thermonuclease family protein n=1 Tax=Rhizobium fredii TaxID=380 RepID=A0A844AAP1_RHIFR|nr:thermonuclease family protein [Sinorhizobium fredii]AWM24063.1 putative periplasmic protein [Sinorhizobium fredii CCBAU 25509]KSV87113.1 succinoglycan biosynthesis protein ExoI [Sinorhizobium fredii USDA 205]MQX10189.1 thermonuclease family protein [Sinorhizobium fredii]GEC32174.1 succinoglycan biosynthesis protein exoi [Sinorhizobium fredii]GLS07394.1 succinoglycan biosynthesis protein exoi [Sinorhizobium fredii]